MMGLIAEGEEVIAESKGKEDLAADLALIAAAQKVEHYEIASYLSARSLASQAGQSQAALLLSQTLLEEERTDKLLTRFATLLMEGAGVIDSASREEKGDGGNDRESPEPGPRGKTARNRVKTKTPRRCKRFFRHHTDSDDQVSNEHEIAPENLPGGSFVSLEAPNSPASFMRLNGINVP